MVLHLYRELTHRHPDLKERPAVAVISPYKAQVGGSRRAPWCRHGVGKGLEASVLQPICHVFRYRSYATHCCVRWALTPSNMWMSTQLTASRQAAF